MSARDERRRNVEAMTRAGIPTHDIAAALGITTRTVTRDRRALGCSLAGTAIPLTADELHRAAQLLADGCSYTDTARTIGHSATALRKHFPGQGWSPTQIGQHAVASRRLNNLKAST